MSEDGAAGDGIETAFARLELAVAEIERASQDGDQRQSQMVVENAALRQLNDDVSRRLDATILRIDRLLKA